MRCVGRMIVNSFVHPACCYNARGVINLIAPACPGTNGTYGFMTNSRSTKELENLFLPSRLLICRLKSGSKACSTMHCTSPSVAKASWLGRKLSALVEQVFYLLCGSRERWSDQATRKSYEVISARRKLKQKMLTKQKAKSEVYFMSLLFLKFLNTY